MAIKPQNISAVIVIIAILAALSAYLWADRIAREHHGPLHIAAATEHVVVSDGRGLVEMDIDDGRITNQADFSELGLSPPLMDLQLLDTGELLVADKAKLIRRCTQGLSGDCYPMADLTDLTGRFFKFHFDQASERLFVAATHSNKVWLVRPPYDSSDAVDLVKGLLAPNEIWLAPDGRLWIADTDKRRLVETDVDPRNGPIEPSGRILEGRNDLTGKSFPLDFAGSGYGPWWILLSDATYLSTDLLRYSREGSSEHLVALPIDSDPISIEALPSGLLVSDMENFGLWQVSDTGEVTAFGGADYLNRMTWIHGQHDDYQQKAYIAFAVLVAGLIAALGVAIWAHRSGITVAARQKTVPVTEDVEPLEAENGIYWIRPDATYLKQMKYLSAFLTFLPLVMATYIQYLIPGAPISELLHEIFWPFSLAIALGVLLWFLYSRVPSIGSDGEYLYLLDTNRPPQATPPSSIRYTNRVIQIGTRFILIGDRTNKRFLYNQGHIDKYVNPVLEKATQISVWEIIIELIKHGGMKFWLPTIFFSMVMLRWLISSSH